MPGGLAAQEDDYFANDFVHINQLLLRSNILEKQADAADDFRGALSIFDDSGGGRAGLFDVGRVAGEPAQAGAGVGAGGGNRLLHFVREGGGQLAHGGHAADARQIFLGFAQRLRSTLALLDVDSGSVPLNDVAEVIAQGHGAGQPPAIIAVRPAEAHFTLAGLASGEGAAPLFDVTREIIGMNYGGPIPAERVLHAEAGSFEPTAIDEIHGAVGAGAPDMRGNGVDDEAEAIFALLQGGVEILQASFFFNDTATTDIYTLFLHDALPNSKSSLSL